MKTDKARRVLDDARTALEKFNQAPIDVEFRHLVVLCCTLIRAVGHVVETENEDNKINHDKLNSYYKDKIKDSEIFKNFIKSTRDTVLKEYTAYIGWASITTLNKDHRMEYLVKEGEYKDKDFRDLMRESIEFWDNHLSKIENL